MTPTTPNHPHIEMVPRERLRPNPANPRRHNKKQLMQIGSSLTRFGWLVPIVVDDDNLIVAGHGRWEAAALRQINEVPVIRARFVTEADRRAFALAENRLSELSDWDEDLLAQELEFLFDQDYDLDVTGFSLADLDAGMVNSGDEDDRVDLPDPLTRPVSRPGDLWLIGPHRLLCGNARDAVSYDVLLGDERAAMVFSDPPYNVRIDGNAVGKGRHREFVEASGELSAAEFTSFLRSAFEHCAHFSADGSIHFHCMDWRHMREMLDAADGVYEEFKQLVVWAKSQGGMGSFYRSRHELIFVFKSGTGRHINNFGLGEKGRYRTNVWEHAGVNSFRPGRADDLADHPTIKPKAMVADAILDCSHRGDLILDPFCGSGTTLIAAERTKRRCAAIELDPLYVDVALRRLREASGHAVTLSDGRSSEEVAVSRSDEEQVDG